MIEFLLLIIGILFGIWWWNVIILPLFYGIPKATYYVWKGLLKKSAIVFYLKSFLLWNVIWIGASFVMVKYSPELVNRLLDSAGFGLGQFIGIVMSAWRVFTKDGRKDLNADFWSIMHGYIRRVENVKDIFVKAEANDRLCQQSEEKFKSLLSQYGDRYDIKDIFGILMTGGADEITATKVITDATYLQRYLNLKEEGVSDLEIALILRKEIAGY